MEGALWGSLFTESTNPEGFSPLSRAYNGVRSFRPIRRRRLEKSRARPRLGNTVIHKRKELT